MLYMGQGTARWYRELPDREKDTWPEYVIRAKTVEIPSVFPADCGFQVLGWINAKANGADYQGLPPIAALYWRQRFLKYLDKTEKGKDPAQGIKMGGALHEDDPLQAAVRDLLCQHGVPPQAADERATTIIQTLGRQQTQQAMRANRPWQDLKAKANQRLPRLQLVMPSELEEVIKQRAGTSIGTKSQKTHRQPGPRPELQPGDLHVPEGVFRQVPDLPLRQIRQEDIRQDAQGIVLLDGQQALPYVKHSRPISIKGLALLIFQAEGPEYRGLGEMVRFPAKYVATDEPVIASALLLQLGQVEVTRTKPEHVPQLEETDHIVARAVAYRDELGKEWQDFIKQPVKHLMQCVPSFRPKEEDRDHILEVWDRQMLTQRLTRTSPDKAELFMVNIRMKGTWHPAVFEGIEDPGIYLEPRTEDGRHPHPAFKILWMGKHTKAEVQTKGQATTQWTSVARTGSKWGLRVSIEAAEELHNQHRPDTPYLPGGRLEHFHVGPILFGTTRKALQKIFSHWAWQARPIHPIQRAADGSGCVWLVQATQDPTSSVWALAHGDVIVTKHGRRSATPTTGPRRPSWAERPRMP